MVKALRNMASSCIATGCQQLPAPQRIATILSNLHSAGENEKKFSPQNRMASSGTAIPPLVLMEN